MTSKKLDADALLDLAIETLKTDLAPSLPADKRYAAAMVVNALEIARRDVSGEEGTVGLELLDRVYDDGEGTFRQLSGDIRSGRVTDAAVPDLRKQLRAMLIAELRVRNPRFLKSRDVRG